MAPAKAKYTRFGRTGSTLTAPLGINDSGVVSGYYVDSSDADRGFMRAAGATITRFDPPGSTDTAAASRSTTRARSRAGILTAKMRFTGISERRNDREDGAGYVVNTFLRILSFRCCELHANFEKCLYEPGRRQGGFRSP